VLRAISQLRRPTGRSAEYRIAALSNLTQIYDIDLKLLKCFCTIVEEGSFTGAQATLNLSQSMLSEYLKSLEVRLGTRLCQRGPKGFKLFREGEIVYEAAKELFASVETFRQRASNLNDGAGHELVIGIQDNIVDNPKARVAEAITRFYEYYPNIRFRLEIMLGFQLTGRVADGFVHVGVGLVNDQFSQLNFEHLFDEEAHFYCSRAHPLFAIDESEISQEQIESATYANRGHLELYHPERTRNAQTRGDIGHGAHAHMMLILSGRNIGYLPDHVAAPHVKAGKLRALRPDLTRLVTQVAAFTGPRSSDFRLALRFVDCLIDTHMEALDPAAVGRTADGRVETPVPGAGGARSRGAPAGGGAGSPLDRMEDCDPEAARRFAAGPSSRRAKA
jgi:DNA-binding transcriptional LysR family regulator